MPLFLSHHPLEEARCHVVTTLKLLILIHQWADRRNNYNPTASRTKTMITESKMITWITALCNSMKLWAMPCRVPHDRWGIVESSDKTWSTGEGNGKPLQYSCLEHPMNSMKRQKGMTLKDEPHRLEGIQYAIEEEQRIAPERMKRLSQSRNDALWWMSGGESKVWCCREQYCTATGLLIYPSVNMLILVFAAVGNSPTQVWLWMDILTE